MAKKNSTKTATKEAIQNAIPRIQQYTRWQGINLQDLPMDAETHTDHPEPSQWMEKGKSDEQPNFLALQNNVMTASNGTLATRYETINLKDAKANCTFTGVAINYDNYIYAVLDNHIENKEELYRFRLPDEYGQEIGDWELIPMTDNNTVKAPKIKSTSIKSLMVFQSKLIVLTQVTVSEGSTEPIIVGEMYDGLLDTITTVGVANAKFIEAPAEAPNIDRVNVGPGEVSRLRFTYVYNNKYGSTTQSDTKTITTDVSPVEFQSTKYLRIYGTLPTDHADITGVDIYCTMDESQDYIFIGHVGLTPDDTSWSYAWLGAMADTSQWTTSSLTLPYENTTQGVDACYMDQYDGRIYFYGGSTKYRLYIGGNPGSELSVATGLGGAFVDIEPGSGQEIRKVLKFKTYNGATVVTLLTYHPNTNKSSRYNLLETEITVTNEFGANGYDSEKVDSVLGTSSYYGADTFIDGLYAVNRYGLAFTTKTQENQNNLRVMYCSNAIKPLFESMYGYQINNSRLLCINDLIYLCVAKETDVNNREIDPPLEDFIFCYDAKAKAWFTYKVFPADENHIMKAIINVDYNHYIEGIGAITNKAIYLVPTTGDDYANYYVGSSPIAGYPRLETYVETHELALKQPISNLFYCNQLEVNFDCICAPDGLDVWIEGYDYYGRHFKVHKNIVETELQRQSSYYLRVDRYVKSFRLFIKGKAHYRLTHINMKCFQQSSSIGNAYGFDTWHEQKKQHGMQNLEHHTVSNYNDLKEIIMT